MQVAGADQQPDSVEYFRFVDFGTVVYRASLRVMIPPLRISGFTADRFGF
jgi:hypothetical protein